MLRDALGDQEVMLNANAVAASRDALAVRVLGQQGFKIDPVTMRLDPAMGWTQGTSGLKRGYRILASAYGRGLDFDLLGAIQWRNVSVEDRARYLANVLDFQRGHLLRETRDLLQLFSPTELTSVELGVRPTALLAPYVHVEGEDAIADQIALWQVTPQSFEGIPVELVVALGRRALEDDALIARLAAEVIGRPHAAMWVWVPGLRLKLSSVLARRVNGYRNLVRILAGSKKVKALHADFIEFLMSYEGVDEGCSGPQLGVAEEASRGAGLTIGLFYSPIAHAFVPYKVAARVVERCSSASELAEELCPCALCADLFHEGKATFNGLLLAGTPLKTKNGLSDTVVQATRDAAQMNRFHNLLARQIEVNEIRNSSASEMSDRLMRSALRLLEDRNGVLKWLGSALRRSVA